MSLLLKPRVKETTTATGTGTLLLDGAVDGYFHFVDAFGVNGFCYYTIIDGSQWESGIGQISALAVLDRARVLRSSNSNNAINVAAGTKTVYCAIPPEAVTCDGTQVFGDADTTPTVKNGNAFLASNTGATTITFFDDAWEGQQITISFDTNNTTIQHNAAVRLAGGSNFAATTNDTISLVYYNAIWYELSRAVNS